MENHHHIYLPEEFELHFFRLNSLFGCNSWNKKQFSNWIISSATNNNPKIRVRLVYIILPTTFCCRRERSLEISWTNKLKVVLKGTLYSVSIYIQSAVQTLYMFYILHNNTSGIYTCTSPSPWKQITGKMYSNKSWWRLTLYWQMYSLTGNLLSQSAALHI